MVHDLDKITDWAAEFGWEVVETDPPVLTKAGRTLQLKFNTAGKLSSLTWIGGDEHSETIPGTTSLNKLREWMATDLSS